MNNNDLRAKIQEVLDQMEQDRTQYPNFADREYAIALHKIKQILASTPLEEFLATLLDYKFKGYTYLKQIKFYTRQIEVTLWNEATGYTFTNDYELQANESFSEVAKQIIEIFYNNS